MTVVTAIFGDYDEVPPTPLASNHAVQVLVTDSTDVARHAAERGWTAKIVTPMFKHGRWDAKVPKCMPHLFGADGRHDVTCVWVDASLRIDGGVLTDIAASVPRNSVGAFAHHERSDIVDEAVFSLQRVPSKYAGQPLLDQAYSYIGRALDPGGLWCCGFLVYAAGSFTNLLGSAWLSEQLAWQSWQDQISFGAASSLSDVPIVTLQDVGWEGTIFDHLRRVEHNRND